MKNLIKIAFVMPVLLALLLAGCALDDPSDPTNQVNDLTPAEAPAQLVTIGNSLTAGYMDSGLMKAGQANSFGNLVANQMGVEFTQPWVDAPGIGSTNVGEGLTAGVLYFTGSSVLPLAVTPTAEVPGLLLAGAQPTPYHNLGVPGARLDELMTTHSGATSFGAPDKPNSFFDLINRSGALFGNIDVPAAPPVPAFATASQFGQAVAKGALVSTLFIGGNDFLEGAVSGDPIDSSLITDPTIWGGNYAQFIGTYAGAVGQRLGFDPTTQEGIKPNIVVITLPMVDNIPYFLSQADFSAVFGAWPGLEEDYSYVLITDFLAWYAANLGEGGIPTAPMPTAMTLSPAEVSYLDNNIIGAYNSIIAGVTNGLMEGTETFPAMANFITVDINAGLGALAPENTQHFLYLRAIHPGDTIAETAARTFFSLDGVHPNNKGYVFLANSVLGAINELMETSYEEIPLAAGVWDPTYGVPVLTKAATHPWPVLSPEVAEGMKAIFR